MNPNRPFALSFSKGFNAQKWFDKPVLSRAEGLTTNVVRDNVCSETIRRVKNSRLDQTMSVTR